MKTWEELKKVLLYGRDYGIWVVAVLLCINFWLLLRHDQQVKRVIIPELKQTEQTMEADRKLIDSLKVKTDTVWNTLQQIHQLKLRQQKH
jgi:hypothetical protein